MLQAGNSRARGLARLMQTKSYASSQPPGNYSRIPRARGKGNSDTNTRTRERVNEIPSKQGWGGARNRWDRETTGLTLSHAEGMLMAMAYADLCGLPLTRHWIIAYEKAGIDDSDGAAFVGRLLIFLRRYARARGGSFAAVWVREFGKRNRAHVHIAFHWPRGWKLGYLTRRWIIAAGGTYRKTVSRVEPIGGRVDRAWTNPPLYRANLEKLGNYFVKAGDDMAAAELGLSLRKSGGAIIGKRCGWSENLGAAARGRCVSAMMETNLSEV